MWHFYIVTIFIVISSAVSQVPGKLPGNGDQSLNYRLPNDSRPVHYDLYIETDIHSGSDKFIGLAKIYVQIMESTDVITMHFSNASMVIKSIDYLGTLPLTNLSYEIIPSLDFIKIKLPTIVPRNAEIILTISYEGQFFDDPRGFYRTYFIDEHYAPVWLISTYLQPTNARMAFPCYDEPQIKATFQLQIRHDKSYKAISNTPAINVTDHQNYVVTTFETTPLMQSYLLAFVVSKFEVIENRDLNFPQRIFGDPQKIANGDGEFAIKIVSEVYQKIVDVFNFSIPLTKLDHAGIPQMNGALETFGLITYSEDFLLLNGNFDEQVLNFFKPQTITFIAHEILHQLIGNTVSIRDWQHLWMSEGLTMFFHHYIPSLLYPEYDFMEIFRTQVLGFSFMMDDGNETMNDYAETPDEIRKKFNSISFEKSAAVIRMFFEALTPATFIKGLSYYLREMQFKSVVPDDFHRALQRAYDEDNKAITVDVGKMMEKWENLPGFPLLSVTRDGNKIMVSQKRYRLDFEGYVDYPKYYDDCLNPIYSIPLTFATTSDPSFDLRVRQWMTEESTVISNIQPDEWVIFNVQQVGYYKVDYSRDIWTTIIDAYKRDPESIPKINREVLHAEMFDGWMNLGTKSISDCLELLRVLEVEREGAVWERAGQYIEELKKFFLFSEFYDNFLALMHAQLAPHVDSLEKDDKSMSILGEQVTRWSKETQHESYLRLELDKLIDYMNTGDENKRPDFCSGFRIANASVYNHFFDKVFNEEILFDFELVSSLSCRQDGRKLEDLLTNMLDSKKIKNEFLIMEVFSSTMRNSLLGLETVMDFSHRRMKDIVKISSFPPLNMVTLLSALINSPRLHEKYKSLTNKFVDDGILTKEDTMPLLSAIESKLESSEWDETKKWFEEQTTQETSSPTTSSTTGKATTTTRSSTTSTLSTSIRIIAICLTIKTLVM